ncbi:aldehyde dehydrogenase family protein [Pseudomonas putida]|uniref:aldehyde dehydrogenase family protein n=1 Tax=Pseudomonas putida TaxID=303 RepID=UPI0029DE6572|nr:aldehyde dehydrogenase family protein [Pseudomonas putida]WPJ98257.1 aldehyde dehydrogenase family protein [Pseudomonas putida]
MPAHDVIDLSYPAISSEAASFLGKSHKLFIEGQWQDAQSGARRKVFDPATGKVIAEVADGDQADVEKAVSAARKSFDSGAWRKLSGSEKSKVLWRIGELIDKYSQELAELEVLDEGSPYGIVKDAYVRNSAEHFRYYSGWCTKLNGLSVPVGLAGEWHAYTTHEPVGVVGQIIPWNVPLLMAAWKLAPALAAGCSIVLKPAEDTPLTALRLAAICEEAGLPPGTLNVVTGDGRCGAAMVNSPLVDKIAFTGSTATGKAIASAAAKTLKRVTLELGGKSPVIVFPDADLSTAIPGVAQAVMLNSGQACTAGSRLYIHEDVYDDVINGVAEFISEMKLGHGLNRATQIGPLISQRQLGRVSELVRAGVSEGAKVICGASEMDGEGFFYKPTLLANVDHRMTVYREEIFGPVISAMKISNQNLDDLAREANNTEYGLAASIWTQNITQAHALAARIRAGIIWINSHNQIDPSLPFGGFKESGIGREMGLSGLEHYTETKSVAVLLKS